MLVGALRASAPEAGMMSSDQYVSIIYFIRAVALIGRNCRSNRHQARE